MAKIKIIVLSTFFLFFSKGILSYEITDLIKILVEKNETNSKFKYDNLIDEKNLELANSKFFSSIRLSYLNLEFVSFFSTRIFIKSVIS